MTDGTKVKIKGGVAFYGGVEGVIVRREAELSDVFDEDAYVVDIGKYGKRLFAKHELEEAA